MRAFKLFLALIFAAQFFLALKSFAQVDYVIKKKDSHSKIETKSDYRDIIEFRGITSSPDEIALRLLTNADASFTMHNGSFTTSDRGQNRRFPTQLIDSEIYENKRFYIISDTLTALHATSFEGKNLLIEQGFGKIRVAVTMSKFDRFDLISTRTWSMSLDQDSIDLVNFIGSELPFINLESAYLRSLYFSDCTLGEFQAGGELPDTLWFYHISLENEGQLFDMTRLNNSSHKEACLYADEHALSLLKLNYVNYNWRLSHDDASIGNDKSMTAAMMRNCYSTLIAMQKRYGYSDGEEKVTKEYKEFEYTNGGTTWGNLRNWLDKTWWDYGYNKSLIFRNTFYLFIFFYLINLVFYKKLVRKVYPVDAIIENDRHIYKPRLRDRLIDSVYCLFYTGFIFFGLKLGFDKLKLKHLGLASYIIIQYLIGVVCLAYMAGYILSK